jgi:hypothetical protein
MVRHLIHTLCEPQKLGRRSRALPGGRLTNAKDS